MDDGIDQQGEGALGGDLRIELAQGPCGRITGVQVGLFPFLLETFVQLDEFVPGDERFAAHHKCLRDGGAARGDGDVERQGVDRAQVFGDVLADLSVPAGGAPREKAVLIVQDNRQAVQLGLDCEIGLGHERVQFRDPGMPIPDVRHAERVGEAEDGRRVGDLLEPLLRVCAGPLAGGIRRDPVGMRRLDRFQPLRELVELVIADHRVIQHIIAVVVMADLVFELFVFLFEII